MKFNWGTGIAVFYLTFMAVLIVAVIRSTQFDNSLVSDHYYQDDLNYQQHYNKLVNSQSLAQDLIVREDPQKERVELIFPADLRSKATGEIHFFCPSDSDQDFRVPITAESGATMQIPTTDLKPGLWKVKVDWQANGKAFFKEAVVHL